MRIAINARVLQKDRMEGVARYIYEVTRRMVAQHPEDDFYLLFDRPFDSSFIFGDNVTALHIGFPARHPQLFKLWFEYSVYNTLKKHKIDVFFSGDAYLSLRSKVPSVMVSHDLAYIHYPDHLPKHHLRYYKKYFPKFHFYADKIIAVSKATKQDIVKQFGINKNKISVAHNAAPDGFVAVTDRVKIQTRIKYSGGKPYFIYLGSLHPRKNVVNLITAYGAYRDTELNNYQLVIVGRPAWNYDQIEKTYNESKYYSDIHIYHNIKEEAKALLASAEALFYISMFEGFGIPVLEAFASEVPVVTSNISSMPEVAGDAAILVDPTNISAIALAFTQVQSIDLRSSMISKGLMRLKDFNWEKTAELIYNELKKVAHLK